MGELLADAVALLRARGGPLLELDPHARAVIDEARREGRGVVFASAHLGPWERVAASLVAAGVPLDDAGAGELRSSLHAHVRALARRPRRARGLAVGRSIDDGDRGIVRTLRAGGVLGVPMDLRSRVPSCAAMFLGHPAPTPVGPARIALRTGAAVVVGTVAPAGDALVITATRIPTGDLDFRAGGAELELTARINRELSRRILALPHAWVWMHERWTPSAEYGVNFG